MYSISLSSYLAVINWKWKSEDTMCEFVSGFINTTNLNIDVEWQICTTLLVSQLPVCIWSYFCLCSDNWLTFNFEVSKCNYYTWISKWQKCKLRSTANVNDHTYKLRKPSFTANATSPRMLVRAKPCLKSTCYRFKFHLRIIPGRGKCILRSPVVVITWPAKFDLCAKLST